MARNLDNTTHCELLRSVKLNKKGRVHTEIDGKESERERERGNHRTKDGETLNLNMNMNTKRIMVTKQQAQ